MKLDRNENEDGCGKYALVKLRRVRQITASSDEAKKKKVLDALRVLDDEGILDHGLVGSESEFFPIKLRDINAHAALTSYAASVLITSVAPETGFVDKEYFNEILDMAGRSGPLSVFCKRPD